MRLDKYLKVARIIKRRTVANEACSGDRVTVNGKEAKPSKDVKPGDVITVGFGDKKLTFRVLEVPEGNVAKNASASLFEIIESK
ncbi:MAG TPA: RNA-binding S4 domain-containing protein [Clostridia bacterium]|jgi:ribosomal 50S subunit-recycling heat shock protein|nr:RNA-binding S4 domain-containing protein [Clostridia bacterium]